MRVIVAITGASGVIYGKRLIEVLIDKKIEVTLIISKNSVSIIKDELGVSIDDLTKFKPEELLKERGREVKYYHYKDLTSPFASGSNYFDAMVIVPCSMSTLARIAQGNSDNLILRIADVALKENRKLILVPRETPLSYIHLVNMTKLIQAGAIILPAMPAFYNHPKTIKDLVDFIVFRILNQLKI
jgi:4-hydroxy-3-polyprenylbenzoate decarboxylase